MSLPASPLQDSKVYLCHSNLVRAAGIASCPPLLRYAFVKQNETNPAGNSTVKSDLHELAGVSRR